MKTLNQIFEKLITNQIVSVESVQPYEKSLTTLLDNYYGGKDELFVIIVDDYGTHFYIPENDLHETCLNKAIENGIDIDSEEYEDFESNFFCYIRPISRILKTQTV